MWLQLVLHIDLSSSLRFRGAAGLTAERRQVCIERSVRSLLPEGSWKGWCCYAPSNINLCFPAGFNPNKHIEQLSIMNPITMGGKKEDFRMDLRGGFRFDGQLGFEESLF